MFDGGHTGNFMVSSPFLDGVIAAGGLAIHSRTHGEGFTV